MLELVYNQNRPIDLDQKRQLLCLCLCPAAVQMEAPESRLLL